jgi:hypothetical protein
MVDDKENPRDAASDEDDGSPAPFQLEDREAKPDPECDGPILSNIE